MLTYYNCEDKKFINNKSGIDKCRFHDIRHTFTSRLIVDEKEDYATVMALTGHKDISMLVRMKKPPTKGLCSECGS